MNGASESDRSDRLARQAAEAIGIAFVTYQAEFKTITRRAQERFAARDWRGAQKDTVERLELYKKIVQGIVRQVREILAEQAQNRALWAAMKAEYSRALVAGRLDYELAETFFNSITRQIFITVGVDPNIEFVDSDFEPRPGGRPEAICHTFLPSEEGGAATSERLVSEILATFPLPEGWEDRPRDVRLAGQAIHAHLTAQWGQAGFSRAEILRPVFYRGSGAYLVGRVIAASEEAGQERILPLVLCLLHQPQGVCLDAVLLDENEVSIVFSFTRSYFHVDVERPHEMIAFLKSIMPLKRIAELYIAIGYNKHGKTELYRDLLRHLANSSDPFRIAPGERGMVMVVFAMDSFDLVFKVIKDRVDPPKTTTRQEVMERYDLVFKHDRAGRLVDAQEFEHLRFDRDRFCEELLEELMRVAPNTVSMDGECVVVRHLYVERRLTPLNLYVKGAGEAAARAAVLDYGQAIKDLAATNIFPGDVLLKNFGVTRHGRVVFYDYDELCLVTDCKFRKMPPASSFMDEFEAEPWFYVGPMDIFPEEFRTFLGLLEPLRSTFIAAHEDLFGVEFWRAMQKRHQAGEVVDIFPYPENKHLLPRV